MTIGANIRSSTVQGAGPATVWFGPTADVTESRICDESRLRRIRASDLRDAARKSARYRETVPGPQAVLIDIDVILDDDAGEALRTYDEIDSRSRANLSSKLHYVGTPTGLAGLLSDINSLGIADGVVLVPVQVRPGPDGADQLALERHHQSPDMRM
ncbi:hypothetical protein GGC64_005854 [Mycobacterium sp. OAS707]|uniref:hypothetical protein n=1 Tax=Mycobacterium sp. OAS707 TaxID=2663822 RepID=UPI00178AB4CC|nr:hypothetical protein [Mycobacterium sp. OAS707]MBE1551767.1 hypothetical protein [Mycobacterium sp. OAS707]